MEPGIQHGRESWEGQGIPTGSRVFSGAWEGKELFLMSTVGQVSFHFEHLGSREADVSHFLGPAPGAGV